MRIGIIAAMNCEIEDILAFSHEKGTENVYGRRLWRSEYQGHELFMGVCGIGKANAASFCQLLIDRYKADLIINCGVAGSLDPKLKVMDLLLADRLYYHDFPNDILKGTYPGRAFFETDQQLTDKAQKAVPAGIRVLRGGVATGDDFINSSEKKNRIKKETGALACDMESAAIAQVCNGAGLPCLIFRSISDEADESGDFSFEQFAVRAAKVAADTVKGFLDEI